MNPPRGDLVGTVELAGRVAAEDKRRSAYLLLPVDVPEGIVRLEVAYTFSGEAQGNVLDIGLFDPRGSEFLQADGFRGWSGGARRAFFVAESEATPGYLPGPILPGRWEVILGLYRVQPDGCEYQVTARLYSGPPSRAPGLPPPAWPVVCDRPGWYRGDLHCHTHHSDATGSLADLAAAARAEGLDFVAVTEHNTTSHLPHLPAHSREGLLLLPGLEITTERGHLNAWGVRRWHEFRCETADQMAQVVAEVRSAGALVSINHPKPFGPPWTFGGEEAFDCIEVWQAHWRALNEQSVALWDRLLGEGHRITAVGGSDAHQTPAGSDRVQLTVGRPCTWIYADALSVEGLLAGLRAGRVFVSESPAGPRLSLAATTEDDPPVEALMGDELRVSAGASVTLHGVVENAQGGCLRIRSKHRSWTVPIRRRHFEVDWRARVDADTHYRLEVLAESELDDLVVTALSNPVYLRVDRDTLKGRFAPPASR